LPAVNRYGRVAQRFLISILQQYWMDAPAVIREWAEELEAWGAVIEREVELSAGRGPREPSCPGFTRIENDL